MFRSMYAGVTGIKVHQIWLDVIGDNVANVNTVGYKKSRALFSSKFSEMLQSADAPREGRGGENPKQIGLGTQLSQLQTMHTPGAMKYTGKNTDIAIQGSGYFVLKELACHVAYYTKAGAFDFDRDGSYVDPSTGFHVQGWNAERGKNPSLKIDPLTGESIINVGKPMENIKIVKNDVLPAKKTREVRIDGNLNSESPFMIDSKKISFTKGVSSTSAASAGEGIDTKISWIDAGFAKTPDGTVTINGATFSLAIFTTPDDLMNAINKSAQAKVTIEYDEGTDRFNISPDKPGIDIVLSENPKTPGCGLFTQAKIPLGRFDSSVEALIQFTHLFDPTNPNRTYVRWRAVDPETWDLIKTNAYFYKPGEEVGEGDDKIAVTDEYVGLGDGVKTTFQLANPDVDYLSLKVYRDGTEVPRADYTFSNNTGPNGLDEITFSTTAIPGAGAKITVSYDRIGFNLDATSVDPTTLIAKVDEVIQARTAYYVSNNTGPGGVDQIIFHEVKDARIGTGNDAARKFKLDSNLIDSRTLRVYVNGIEQDPRTAWMFHDNTGPGGVDEIEFLTAPGAGKAIKADYYYAPEGRAVRYNYAARGASSGDTITLQSSLVDPNTLIVYDDGTPTTAYTFSDNTGPNGKDQITINFGGNVCIDYTPLKAQKVTADYYYNKDQEAKGILQLDENGKVIGHFVDTEAFPAIVSGTEVIAGPGTIDLAGGWDQFDGGIVDGTITIITTSGRYVSRPINATNYPTVQSLINEINASEARVTVSYDIITDKFTLKSDTPGDTMTLEESGTVPFFSEINIPTGTVEGGNNNDVMDLETEIPDPFLDRWGETTGIMGSGRDFFRVNVSPNTVANEAVGKGGEEARGTKVTREEVGTGGGGRLVMGEELVVYNAGNTPTLITYTLANRDVNPNTIKLWYYDLAPTPTIVQITNYTFRDNTGTNGEDQVTINAWPGGIAPAAGDGIIIDYNRDYFELNVQDVDRASLVIRADGAANTYFTFLNNQGTNRTDAIQWIDSTKAPGVGRAITADYTINNAFNLDNSDVDPTTMTIQKNDGLLQPHEFYFLDGTGEGGVDQISFKQVAEKIGAVTQGVVEYSSTGATGILAGGLLADTNFDLPHADVDRKSLRIWSGATYIADANIIFTDGAGTNGVDRIQLTAALAANNANRIEYRRNVFNFGSEIVDPNKIQILVNEDVQAPTNYTFSNNAGVGGLDQVRINNIQNRSIKIVADGTRGVAANRIELPSSNVDVDTLRVSVAGTRNTRVGGGLGANEFMFVNNGGPNGEDQIYFSAAPAAGDDIDITYYDGNTACAEIFANYTLESNPTPGQEITADYRRTTARTVDVFIPNGNEGPETLTFTPNTTVTSYESGERPNLADTGAPVTATVKDPAVYRYQFGESVFDSLGVDRVLQFICERIEENKWIWFVRNPVEKDKIAGYGLLIFKGDGEYDADNSQVFGSPSDPAGVGARFRGIYFDPPEDPSDATGAPPPEKGAKAVKIDLYFDKSKITQFSQHVSNADVYYQDGYGMGTLKEVKINEQGVIIGKYSNAKDLDLAQIAVATFINPSGLEKEGATYFLESGNSGKPDFGIPGTEKRGIIKPENLEMSNVDLTKEFTDMIIAERAFMANSRTISTADRLLLDILRLRP